MVMVTGVVLLSCSPCLSPTFSGLMPRAGHPLDLLKLLGARRPALAHLAIIRVLNGVSLGPSRVSQSEELRKKDLEERL